MTTPTTVQGEPVLLFMYNDTIANMGNTGVTVQGPTQDDSHFPDPMEFLALNNTFYNDPIAVNLLSVAYSAARRRTTARTSSSSGWTTSSTARRRPP